MWYSCQVIKGAGRGKTIGFPTLNLTLPKGFDYQLGIYAGWVRFKQQTFKGAFHFGPVLTFGQQVPTLEVFVLDQTINTTPKKVEVQLAKFIRPPKKFNDVPTLTAQIKKDVQEISLILDADNLTQS